MSKSALLRNEINAQWETEIQNVPVGKAGDDYKPEEGVMLRANVYGPTPLISVAPRAVTSGSQTREFADAANHPVVKAALDFRIRGALQRGFELVSPNEAYYSQHPGWRYLDKQIMELIRNQVAAFPDLMGMTIKQLLEMVLRNGIVHGFNVAEPLLKMMRHYWWLQGVLTPEPFLFDAWIDDSNLLAGVQYWYNGELIIEKDMGKLAWTPYPRLMNLNYYGKSDIQCIMQDLERLNAVEDNGLRALNNLATKHIIVRYDESAKKKIDVVGLANALRNAKSGAVITVPALELGGENDDVYTSSMQIEVLASLAEPEAINLILKYLEYYPKRINRALGVPDDLGLTTTGVGSNAKAVTEDVSVVEPVHAQDRDFCRGFMNNVIIPWMTKWNWPVLPPGYQLPRFGKDDEFDALDLIRMNDRDRNEELVSDAE